VTIDWVVIDIEGTVSSTSFVHEVLFPYSRQRIEPWLADHRTETEVRAIVAATAELAGVPADDPVAVAGALRAWIDADAKIGPLKALQGLIWDEGFDSGALQSHFYPDSLPALTRWRQEGRRLAVFSSGSVRAQRAWFGHSPAGDVTGWFDAFFDTETAGPKRESASYRRIAAALGADPARSVFLSDVVGELDAARAAGWLTVGVRRPGDLYYADGVGAHLEIDRLDRLDLSGAQPAPA
jgi:enolase-phosphatase E1